MATAYPGGLRKRGGLLDYEDTIQATPRNAFFGGVADLLGQAYKLPEMPRLGVPGLDFVAANRNRLMDLLGVGDVQKTAEAMAYGNRLGTGAGMTYRPLPETMGAAMAVAPFAGKAIRAIEGLPVGASIKFIDLNKGIYKPEVTMEEMLKVKDIPTVERVKQSLDLVGDKTFENMVKAKFKEYQPTNERQKALLVESVTLEILGRAQRSPYPQAEAMRLAQQRAALPVEQGGLGLLESNTAMDRAKAMGFDLPTYHGTNTPNISSIDVSKSRSDVQYMPGFFTADDPNLAQNYGDIMMPLLQKKGTTILDRRAARQSGQEVPTLDTVYDKEKGILVTSNPENIRSRFAAFDPFRKTAATAAAMGVAAPDLLAAETPEELKRRQLRGLLAP